MSRRKGQNIAEYVILVALIIAAAAAMQVYLKRGLQGRMADAVDYAPSIDPLPGSGTLNFSTRQYEPYYANSASDVGSNSSYAESINQRGGLIRTGISQNTTRARGSYEASEWANFDTR